MKATQRTSLLKQPKKSALIKENTTTPKPERKLVFKDNLEDPPPKQLFKPQRLSGERIANDLEQANYREVWREISSKKLDHAARKLQKFARKHMLCWIIVNDRRTELLEELDEVDVRLKGDLERVQWEYEDMLEGAKLEIPVEMENSPPGERNMKQEQLSIIKCLQSEIRSIKQEMGSMKEASRKLKKENKQLGYDLKERVVPVELSKAKVEQLKQNHERITDNHAQYLPNIKKWQASLDDVDSQLVECQRQAELFKHGVFKAVEMVQKRSKKQRVIDKVMACLQPDFVKYHPDILVSADSRKIIPHGNVIETDESATEIDASTTENDTLNTSSSNYNVGLSSSHRHSHRRNHKHHKKDKTKDKEEKTKTRKTTSEGLNRPSDASSKELAAQHPAGKSDAVDDETRNNKDIDEELVTAVSKSNKFKDNEKQASYDKKKWWEINSNGTENVDTSKEIQVEVSPQPS